MAEHTKNSLITALRRRERILDRLAQSDEDAVAQLRRLDGEITALQTEQNHLYARINGSTKAVTACLEHNGRFMPKEEVVDQLFRGGFDLDPVNGPRLLRELIKKQIQKGRFAEDWDGRIGLLTFPNPKPMTPQRKLFLSTRPK